jgi:hypothetical protein
MDGFGTPAPPSFRIRRTGNARYVIDAHWPYGATEQLVGVFVSRKHAETWLASDIVFHLAARLSPDLQSNDAFRNDNMSSR